MFDLNGHHRAAGRAANLRLAIYAAVPMLLAQSFKVQATTSREAPRFKPPILRAWFLNILWCLEVGFWLLPRQSNPSALHLSTVAIGVFRRISAYASACKRIKAKNIYVETSRKTSNHWAIS
jgi:hypothetical protein